jgi:hypothetical protein
MTTITAIVRNGKLETAEPIDLPDGTELAVPVPNGKHAMAEEWDTSPAGIAAWLKWSASLEPLLGWQDIEEHSRRSDQHEAAMQNRDVEELFR